MLEIVVEFEGISLATLKTCNCAYHLEQYFVVGL